MTRDPYATGSAVVVIIGAGVAFWKKLVRVEAITFRVEDKECQKALAEMRVDSARQSAEHTQALIKIAHLEGEVAGLKAEVEHLTNQLANHKETP